VNIDLPIEKVVKIWDNKNHFSEWQDDFKSITLISGIEGTVGAKSKIVFDGKRKIELLETILINQLPNEKKALYVHIHMTNTQTTRFVVLDANRTQYISEVEYTQFNGWLIKILAKLFPGKFKGQSQKWMDQFKNFAERNK
jgi:uncharacterized membrane protein